MDWKRSEAAFTLLETLFVLTVIMITLPFILYLMHNIQSTSNHDDISVHQFFVYLRDDILNAEAINHHNNHLLFQLNDHETASIEQYNQSIRRRIEGRGHEIYLQNVEAFHVEPISIGYRLSVTTIEGETYEKTMAIFNK